MDKYTPEELIQANEEGRAFISPVSIGQKVYVRGGKHVKCADGVVRLRDVVKSATVRYLIFESHQRRFATKSSSGIVDRFYMKDFHVFVFASKEEALEVTGLPYEDDI